MGFTWKSRRTSLMALGLAAFAAAACDRVESESGGDIAYNWDPSRSESVAGVPTAAVQTAIQQRLAGKAPDGVAEDLWEHVDVLYTAYQGTPLWMDSKGPIEERSSALIRALTDAHSDALRLEEYPITALTQAIVAVQNADSLTAEQLAHAVGTESRAHAGQQLALRHRRQQVHAALLPPASDQFPDGFDFQRFDAQEGAFGTHLLERDVTDAPLMFGAGGILQHLQRGDHDVVRGGRLPPARDGDGELRRRPCRHVADPGRAGRRGRSQDRRRTTPRHPRQSFGHASAACGADDQMDLRPETGRRRL